MQKPETSYHALRESSLRTFVVCLVSSCLLHTIYHTLRESLLRTCHLSSHACHARLCWLMTTELCQIIGSLPALCQCNQSVSIQTHTQIVLKWSASALGELTTFNINLISAWKWLSLAKRSVCFCFLNTMNAERSVLIYRDPLPVCNIKKGFTELRIVFFVRGTKGQSQSQCWWNHTWNVFTRSTIFRKCVI